MNVLIIIDQYGWAYDVIARGIQKYSKNEITIRKLSDVTTHDFASTDLIFLMSWVNLPTLLEQPEFAEIIKRKKIVAGSWSAIVPTASNYCKHTGRRQAPDFSVIDTFIISDRRVWNAMIRSNLYPNANVFIIPPAVDTEQFSPDVLKVKDTFKLGWCGNPTRPDKRVYLLDKLKYPVEKRANWGPQFFVKDRSFKEINDWYNSLDVYVFVSNATLEGCASLTISEAMACGLPVVSTDHASGVSELLDDIMVVPCNPEEEAVKKINDVLDVLKEDVELRRSIGERNRKFVEEHCSWRVVARYYDEIFSQFGFRYVPINTLSKQQKTDFLRRVKDSFINDPDDETLYEWGSYTVDAGGDLHFMENHIQEGVACLNVDGELVGVLGLRWLPTDFGYGDKTIVPTFIVDRTCRGMGIGKQLYELAEQNAIKMGATRYWAANRHNVDGTPLNKTPHIYLKRGFTVVKQYEIISEPEALKLKYSQKWDKRNCIIKVYVKELKP